MAVYILLGIALFLLWWPSHEEERLRDRRRDRELQSERERLQIQCMLEYGEPDLDVVMDAGHEWAHWHTHGRGRPY